MLSIPNVFCRVETLRGTRRVLRRGSARYVRLHRCVGWGTYYLEGMSGINLGGAGITWKGHVEGGPRGRWEI